MICLMWSQARNLLDGLEGHAERTLDALDLGIEVILAYLGWQVVFSKILRPIVDLRSEQQLHNFQGIRLFGAHRSNSACMRIFHGSKASWTVF